MKVPVTRELTLNKYQEGALGTAIYPDKGNNLTYPMVGLAGETGELCNKYKKVLRGDPNGPTKEDLAAELGGVLWYVAALASELGYSLQEIAKNNLEELAGRKERGTITGSGDNR
jgi:NTP pyrophosphatase (non-canonical NTP hydrolase)